MAIHDHENVSGASAASSLHSSRIPEAGLFVKTAVPSGAVSHAVTCSILPPHALSSRLGRLSSFGDDPSATNSYGVTQLVISTETSLQLQAVDKVTQSLVCLYRIPVFGRVKALSSVVSPVAGRDFLVVLCESSKISFVQYDDQTDSVICSGSDYILGPPASLSSTSIREDARLITSYSRKPILAVATLESTISVFPVLFLPSLTSAGKIVTTAVDGIVLSLDFLEDDGIDSSPAILLALVQKASKQYIAVYSVHVLPDPGGGCLSISFVGGMVTGASRHDDIVVARARSKLTGHPVKPPPVATSISRLHGCPYVFFVCLEGRVVIADARVIVSRPEGVCDTNLRSGHLPATSFDAQAMLGGQSSRNFGSEQPHVARRGDSVSGASTYPFDLVAQQAQNDENQTAMETASVYGAGSSPNSTSHAQYPDLSISLAESHGHAGINIGDSAAGASLEFAGDDYLPQNNQNDILSSNREQVAVSSEAAHDQSRDNSAGNSGTGNVSSSSEHIVAISEGSNNTGSSVPIGTTGHPQTPRAFSSLPVPFSPTSRARLCDGNELLGSLSVPPHIALDISDGFEGSVTAFATANIHFSSALSRTETLHMSSSSMVQNEEILGRYDHKQDRALSGASYLVLESGNLYALRWSGVTHSRGASCYVIPSPQLECNLPQDNSQSVLFRAPRYYSIEHVGCVGPAVGLASLNMNLLYVANDGADGSLRRISVRDEEHVQSSLSWCQPRCRRYNIETRQEFLNLAPISDFVILSSALDLNDQGLIQCSPDLEEQDGILPAYPRGRLYKSRETCAGFDSVKSADVDHKNVCEGRSGSQDGKYNDIIRDWSTASLSERELRPLKGARSFSSFRSRSADAVRDTQLVIASGIGRHGTLRFLRPGIPVSVFSKSAPMFPSCNGIWSFSARSMSPRHEFLVLSFAESTGVFLATPPTADASSGKLANIVDGSEASSFVLTQRTISAGRVKDGILAQVHHFGVRFVVLAKTVELESKPRTRDGVVEGVVSQHCYDWKVSENGFVSAGCIGTGCVILAVLLPDNRPQLMLLQHRSVIAETQQPGPHVVSAVKLRDEVSCLSLPTWLEDTERANLGMSCSSARTIPVFVMATYAPSVEIRALRPDMCLLARVKIDAWIANLPVLSRGDCGQRNSSPSTGSIVDDETFERRGSSSMTSDIPCGNTNRSRNRNGSLSVANSATCGRSGTVLESICAVCVSGRCLVFAGSRDGYVLKFDMACNADKALEKCGRLQDVDMCPWQLKLLSRRQLGLKPVRLSLVNIALGRALLAECERPWLLSLVADTWRWMPMNFSETRAGTGFSVPGAKRSIAFVAADDRLYVCGVRRVSSVSVSTVSVGETPSRVLSLDGKLEYLVVATSRENISLPGIPNDEFQGYLRRTPAGSNRQSSDRSVQSTNLDGADIDTGSGRQNSISSGDVECAADIRLFHGRKRKFLSRTSLLPGELVHVLLQWGGYIVVGTSLDLRRSYAQRTPVRDRGRLLLLTVETKHFEESRSASRYATDGNWASSRNSSVDTYKEGNMSLHEEEETGHYKALHAGCEVVLPGAMLAGAVSESQDMLVASSNEYIYVFGLCSDKPAIAEVARVSTRMLVVSISLCQDLVCVADQKDSLAFYRIEFQSRRLVRDRGDFRKRVVADTAFVDRYTAIATDKLGYLFSLSYEESDRAHIRRNGMRDYFSDMTSRVHPFDTAIAQLPSIHDTVISQQLQVGNTDEEDATMENDEHANESLQNTPVDDIESASEEEDEADDMVDEDDAAVTDSYHALSSDGPSYPLTPHASINDSDQAGTHGIGSTDDDENLGDQSDSANPNNIDFTDGNIGIEEESDDAGDDENDIDDDDDGAGDDQMADGESSNDQNPQHTPNVQPVQRNLQCEHSFNLNDTALCLRGRYLARGCDAADSLSDNGESFWDSRRNSVIAGTLSGAIIVGVPTSREEFCVLQNVARVLATFRNLVGIAVSSSHDHFRSAYGKQAIGAVDGDLLELFCGLELTDRIAVAAAAGYDGVDNVHRISALIEELCDHTM